MKQPSILVRWLPCVVGVFFLLTSESSIAQARWSYRGLGTSSSFAVVNKSPVYRVKIQSVQASRNIDQPKLKASIQNKLPQIETCYRQTAWLRIWKRYHLWQTGNMPKQEAKNPPQQDEVLRKLDVKLTLNAYGRAILMQSQTTEMPTFFQNCFLWYLQGRKFFPAEGHHQVSVRIKLEVSMLPARAHVPTPTVVPSVSSVPASSRSMQIIRKRLQIIRKMRRKSRKRR